MHPWCLELGPDYLCCLLLFSLPCSPSSSVSTFLKPSLRLPFLPDPYQTLSQLSKPSLRPPFPPLHRIDDPYRTLVPPYQNQRPLSQILHPFSQPWSPETFISKVLASRLGSNFEPLKHQKPNFYFGKVSFFDFRHGHCKKNRLGNFCLVEKHVAFVSEPCKK